MIVYKITPILLLVIAVGAEKKIELQDIEEDNLKSEKQKEYESPDRSQSSGSGHVSVPLDYLKNGLVRYYESATQPQQPSRYVHQYAVTEPPERPPVAAPKTQYGPPAHQQAMVGYLSNVPVQIYLVPQYYNDVEQHGATAHAAHHSSASAPSAHYTTGAQYTIGPQYSTGVAGVAGYQTAPEAVPTQTNYVQVPTYIPPTAKTYLPQYSPPPVAYVSYNAQATAAPAPTIAPVVAYQVPVVQYTAPVATQAPAKAYYQNTHYQDTNAVEETHQNVDEDPKQYTHSEVSYVKAPSTDYNARYYPARPPPRDDYRHNHIQELPHPNPLLLKGAPSHLSHIPKALPIYRPLNKPVYNTHPGVSFTPRPSEAYGLPFKRRPTSLLDSYIPSSVQFEYLKRGYSNDPLQIYDALSSGRHLPHSPSQRHFERGFLPNQMYHTAGGGVTFGHYERSAKVDKAAKN